MNIYLIIVLSFILGKFFLDLIIEKLNLENLKTKLPEEFKQIYNEKKYRKSQLYTRDKTRTGLIENSIFTILIVTFILTDGFNYIDKLVRSLGYNSIITGTLYILFLVLIFAILNLPFSIYKTFIIEEKYDFNRTTPKTFILDIVKSLFMMIIIGFPLLFAVLWFFEKTGKLASLYIWIFVILFQIFIMYIAPTVIMPIFNKFEPIEDSELKNKIKNYAKKQNFKIKGIYQMDSSKRTSKSNAFFTGFGKSKRIVLFDTLIEKYNSDELLTILAHEMGHYKLKHILKFMIISILETGVMLFILSIFIKNRMLFDAFKMDYLSVYASLVFFGFLYIPVSTITSTAVNYYSRKKEYEADKYSIKTTGMGQIFINTLKKLSIDNLSNLTPHKLKVFFYYSHPPILKRIRELKKQIS